MVDNGSPSQDEIERQNKCLKACGDALLAIEQVWVRLYNEKQITVERAQKELKQCSKDHSLCCAQCVPQRRHFTDDQKDDFREGGKALLIGGGVFAIAGVGAATIFEEPEIGSVFFGIATATSLISLIALKLNVDPIDPNFSKVPILSFPKVPAVRLVRNTGLTGSVARAANAVSANQTETIGLLNALLTALNRSDSAADAGDASAEERQLKAARDFAKKVADALRKAMPLRLALADKLTGPSLDLSISERDALKLRDDLIIDGFPREFFDRLKALGADEDDRALVRQSLIIELANLSNFNQIRPRDSLIDPTWRASDLRLASSLEQFSRS